MQVSPNAFTKKLISSVVLLGLVAISAHVMSGTDEASQLDAGAMRAITTGDTIKTIHGDGSRALHVFISADCTFCRQAERVLEQLDDVTVYRHMLPGHTTAGRATAKEIWCSPEPIQAWKNVAEGKPAVDDKDDKVCDQTALQRNLELAKRLRLTSTPAMIYENGSVSTGLTSAGEMMEMLKTSSMVGQ